MGARIDALARITAIAGGLVLLVLVLLIGVSITGRATESLAHAEALAGHWPWLAAWLQGTGIGQIPGDFELVEAGIAFAVFAFLPLCQLRDGHAAVDIFAAPLGPRANLWLRAFWEAVLAVAIILIAWRLLIGTGDKLRNGQTTFILQFPLWWAYAAALVPAAVAVLVAIRCAGARLGAALRGPGGNSAGAAR